MDRNIRKTLQNLNEGHNFRRDIIRAIDNTVQYLMKNEKELEELGYKPREHNFNNDMERSGMIQQVVLMAAEMMFFRFHDRPNDKISYRETIRDAFFLYYNDDIKDYVTTKRELIWNLFEDDMILVNRKLTNFYDADIMKSKKAFLKVYLWWLLDYDDKINFYTEVKKEIESMTD